jgi:hypothetical protein
MLFFLKNMAWSRKTVSLKKVEKERGYVKKKDGFKIRFFSNLVGEEGPRIQGFKGSRVCFQ